MILASFWLSKGAEQKLIEEIFVFTKIALLPPHFMNSVAPDGTITRGPGGLAAKLLMMSCLQDRGEDPQFI